MTKTLPKLPQVFGINRPVVYDIIQKQKEGDLKDHSKTPNYQWGALDVNSRFKLIGYSQEKSWTVQNHKGHPEENAHLERSHRTDDDEFYIPRVFQIKGKEDLLKESLGYIYYYNNLREHSALRGQTPFAYLKKQVPEIHDTIRFVQPILLDNVSVKLGPWSGYHVLAQNLLRINTIIKKTGRAFFLLDIT